MEKGVEAPKTAESSLILLDYLQAETSHKC